jgi:iron complex outermembrane receptor protein
VVADILADSGLSLIAGVQFPTNALDTRTNGIDVSANWHVQAPRGAFDFLAAINFTSNEITRVDPIPEILEGTGSSYTSALDPVIINAIERNRPGRRSSLTTNYSLGRFRAMGRASDYGSFRDGSLDGLEDFGAKTLFDTEVGYRFDKIGISLGMNNVFNTYPDQVRIDANTNNGTFIWPGSSPFGYNGRFMYVRSEVLLSR